MQGMPLNMPPCMMMQQGQGQYAAGPQPLMIDTEAILGGMYPQDLLMDHNNWAAWGGGIPMDQNFMPVSMQMPINSMPMSPANLNLGTDICSPALVSPGELQTALELIKEAVSGETEDRLFYEYLISVAPSEEDKNIIKGIRDDEIKHFGMFREIYREFTGENLPIVTDGKFQKPKSYCEGLRDALLGEQRAVEKYRKILFALRDRRQINKLVEIITDELRHGSLYNYLYSKNKCGK